MRRGQSFPRAVAILTRSYDFTWWHPLRVFPSKAWMLILVRGERRSEPLTAEEQRREVLGSPLRPIGECPTCERPMPRDEQRRTA